MNSLDDPNMGPAQRFFWPNFKRLPSLNNPRILTETGKTSIIVTFNLRMPNTLMRYKEPARTPHKPGRMDLFQDDKRSCKIIPKLDHCNTLMRIWNHIKSAYADLEITWGFIWSFTNRCMAHQLSQFYTCRAHILMINDPTSPRN